MSLLTLRRIHPQAPAWIGSIAGPKLDRRASLLGYHSVGEGDCRLSMPLDRFKEQLEWMIREGFAFLTLSQWWRRLLANEAIERPMAVLTFDDGYEGVRSCAFPILSKLGIAATVFVVTDYVGTTNGFDRHKAGGISELPLMTWRQLEELKRHGWDIQSHGCRHRRMKGLPQSVLDHETGQSKAELERKLGGPVDFFAYPYGCADDAAELSVRRAGYAGAVACDGGALPSQNTANLYRLQRIMADSLDSLDELRFRLSVGYRRLTGFRAWAGGGWIWNSGNARSAAADA